LIRPLRYGLLTGGLALVVCAVVGGVSLAEFLGARAELAPLTARAMGEVAGGPSGNAVAVRWTPADGGERVDVVALAVDPPSAGSLVEVAYDPAAPQHLVVPGAELLAELESAGGVAAFTAVVAAALLVSGAWQVLTRARAMRRLVGDTVQARRIRVQRGLITRSWLELESGRWVPVHFVPALTALPSPAPVRLHGDPTRTAYVAATLPSPQGPVRVPPSGRVRRIEPTGRRIDNPSVPDAHTLSALDRHGIRAQLRADAPPLVVAPALGGVWAFLIGGGLLGWLAATAVAATLALHIAGVRGSDPS
jgi:hypothetical protein